jgi:hypothetical protein
VVAGRPASRSAEEKAFDVIGEAPAFDWIVPTINDVSTFPVGSTGHCLLGKRPRFYRPFIKTRLA